jgi:hypothetical protein
MPYAGIRDEVIGLRSDRKALCGVREGGVAIRPNRAATTLTRVSSGATHATSGGRLGRSEQTSLPGAILKGR